MSAKFSKRNWLKGRLFYLLNKVDASLQIHTKVNEFPLNAFLFVLFLLEHEHVMVEKLLQPFICVVNAQLLKSVVLEDLKAGNIQHTNKPLTLVLGVESSVDTADEPFEHTIVEGFSQGMGGVNHLFKYYRVINYLFNNFHA